MPWGVRLMPFFFVNVISFSSLCFWFVWETHSRWAYDDTHYLISEEEHNLTLPLLDLYYSSDQLFEVLVTLPITLCHVDGNLVSTTHISRIYTRFFFFFLFSPCKGIIYILFLCPRLLVFFCLLLFLYRKKMCSSMYKNDITKKKHITLYSKKKLLQKWFFKKKSILAFTKMYKKPLKLICSTVDHNISLISLFLVELCLLY